MIRERFIVGGIGEKEAVDPFRQQLTRSVGAVVTLGSPEAAASSTVRLHGS